MSRLPVVSGTRYAAMLRKLGYDYVRQRGSHMIFRSTAGVISVPKHRELDPGLLRSMLKTTSSQTGLSIDELIEMLS